MTAWLTSLRDRPIAESERRGALTVVLVLLILTTGLLVFTRPAVSRHPVTRSATSAITAAAATAHAQVSARSAPPDGAPSPTLARASREFLTGYLAYLYGRAPAGQVDDATQALIRSLRAHPPRVSPVMRGRVARVLALHSTPASPGLIGVRAVINDGGLVDYPIGLLLEDHDGRLLVAGLEGEEG